MLADGFEVLYDDRNASAGIKLTDSELMGIPIRVVISPRTLKEDKVEIKIRGEQEASLIELKNLEEKLKEIIEKEKVKTKDKA